MYPFWVWASALTFQLLPELGATQADEPPRLARLSVVAVNGRGEPVTDLRAAELQILDNNKPQTIVSFRHTDIRETKIAPLGPNEFSNRSGGNAPYATLILFDLLNEHIDARGPALSELVHALQSLDSAKGLYFDILTVDGKIYTVHGPPNSESPSEPADAAPWTRQIKPMMDTAMRAVVRTRLLEMDIDTQVRLTFGALAAVAASLATVPGRKSILWITHGIPIVLNPQVTGADWVDDTPLLRQLSELLDLMNVSIYPIQQIPLGMATAGAPGAQHSGIGSEDTLEQFARYTGGWETGGLGIGHALQRAMNDVRTSYEVAYAPAPRNWDGKFHKIRIVCSRKGVRMQTKERYYAWPEQAFDENQQRNALQAAVEASSDSAEIGIRATVSRDAKDTDTVHLNVNVDPSGITLTRDQTKYTSNLKIAIASYSYFGVNPSIALKSLRLFFTPEQREDAMRNGIQLGQAPLTGRRVKRLRIVVMDCVTGAVGSLTIPVSGGAQFER